MTDSVAQAAVAVKGDLQSISAADVGSLSDVLGVGAADATITDTGTQSGTLAQGTATDAVPVATTLFEKIKAELDDDVLWFENEWDLLKAAIAKHL